jgi:hypothetical protein
MAGGDEHPVPEVHVLADHDRGGCVEDAVLVDEAIRADLEPADGAPPADQHEAGHHEGAVADRVADEAQHARPGPAGATTGEGRHQEPAEGSADIHAAQLLGQHLAELHHRVTTVPGRRHRASVAGRADRPVRGRARGAVSMTRGINGKAGSQRRRGAAAIQYEACPR